MRGHDDDENEQYQRDASAGDTRVENEHVDPNRSEHRAPGHDGARVDRLRSQEEQASRRLKGARQIVKQFDQGSMWVKLFADIGVGDCPVASRRST